MTLVGVPFARTDLQRAAARWDRAMEALVTATNTVDRDAAVFELRFAEVDLRASIQILDLELRARGRRRATLVRIAERSIAGIAAALLALCIMVGIALILQAVSTVIGRP